MAREGADAMSEDPLWDELNAIADTFGPRYARRYGTCPACQRGAHIITAPCGIWWCRCVVCNTRWASRVQDFQLGDGEDEGEDPPALAALREEFTYGEMLALAGCVQFEPRARPAAPTKDIQSGGFTLMLSDYDLTTRSIAKFELLQFAAALGWPSIWLETHRVTIPAGKDAWIGAPLGMAGTRRVAWMQLVALQQRIGHPSPKDKKS
jgi:hypothetical protein